MTEEAPPSGCGETAADLARLDWFTTGVLPGGGQLVHIRPATATDPATVVQLGPEASRLLSAVLGRAGAR